MGCGACTDETYCESSGDNSQEWIGNVTVHTLNNTSDGGAGGYEDFTSMAVDLQRGATYDVSFTPGYPNTAWTEHFRVWIDLNQNGVFNTAEMLFDDDQGSNSTVTGTITIPLSAELGSARMRVSMAYGGQFGGDYPQTSCDDGQDGEVEDYCVNILMEPDGISEVNGTFGMTVFPVPATNELTVSLDQRNSGSSQLILIDVTGKEVRSESINEQRATIDVSDLSSGIYMVRALDAQQNLIGNARFVKQ